MSHRKEGLVAINLAAVIFGSAALYGKLNISPVWIVCLRAFFACLVLTILGALRSKLAWPGKKQLPVLFITGGLLAIHWITFFASVQSGTIAIATLTFATFPLFTVIIENSFRRKRPHIAELFAGVAIIVAVKLLVDIDFQSVNESLSAMMGLASALAFAIFGITSQKIAKSIEPLLISLYQNTIVALFVFPFLFLSSRLPNTSADWGFLLLLGVLNTALMHQLYFYALRRLSAATCSAFVALEPVYAIVFASLLFGEPLSFRVVLSAILILVASLVLLKLASNNGEADQ